jgi:hypothetical protein
MSDELRGIHKMGRLPCILSDAIQVTDMDTSYETADYEWRQDMIS